jgi:GT2 family glycosyltransferase
MSSFEYKASPYYIYAPAPLDEGDESTVQLHVLCSLLNQRGHAAYLVDAPQTDGRLWTPVLPPQQMAAHQMAGRIPVCIAAHPADAESARPGFQVLFQSEFAQGDGQWGQPAALKFNVGGPIDNATISKRVSLGLPWADVQLFIPPEEKSVRVGELVYSGRLIKLNKPTRAEHAGLQDLSAHQAVPPSPAERAKLLQKAETLYAYAKGVVTTEARLCGCRVVYVPNDFTLQTLPSHSLDRWGCELGLNGQSQQAGAAIGSIDGYRKKFLAHTLLDEQVFKNFVDATQREAARMDVTAAWANAHARRLESWLPALPAEKAAKADEFAYKALSKNYAKWSERATMREIYADICAEHISFGRVKPPSVHVFAHGHSMAELANALDDLGMSWLPPAGITIHAPYPSPVPEQDLGENVQWVLDSDTAIQAGSDTDEWRVLLEAGTRLEPNTLLELLLAAVTTPDCEIVFGAEDTLDMGGGVVPFFKGSGHVEWLRSTNFLGGVVAVKTASWLTQENRHRFSSAYALALDATAKRGATSLRYVDRVLSHAPAHLPTDREQEEFDIAAMSLGKYLPGTLVESTPTLGCWQVTYPDLGQQTSLVVPTGKQLGYLKSLIASLTTLAAGSIDEVILVVQPADVESTRALLASMVEDRPSMPIQVVATPDGDYNHARALNTGLAAAKYELVLICDDDVEFIEPHCVIALRRQLSQLGVALAAPRQVLQVGEKPVLMAGPCISGDGAALISYLGEQQWLGEKGLFNRLQMPQDVSGVDGSCFLIRKSAVTEACGFDEVNAPVFSTVAEMGYRLLERGHRLVWTPQATVLHIGGATLRGLRREKATEMRLFSQLMAERDYIATTWTHRAANFGLYSRHFSSRKPYAIDPDLVVDWEPARKDRPRAIAQPISSGSGQYRVIEPLDQLQMKSMAETCLTNLMGRNSRRVLTPMDVARAKPDRIIVQHSIADEDLANLRAIRAACPGAFIVQLMDDLTSDLPKSHPNFVQGQREGHVRTMEALSLSDRLIVSTQPLADYYQALTTDVRLVPNSLDARTWGAFVRTPPLRKRLRVGWAGAAQHLGDLKLIATVVAELADEVDWIFMGMCPDELRPYIKEFHPFVSYKDYAKKLASLDLDIALAPLEDNPFNACKSNLRLLEYGAMGWPVVCSDVYPFRTSSPPVKFVGTAHAEWLAAIRQLMSDPSLRVRQGTAMNQWLIDNYLLENQTDVWFHAIFD